MCGFLIEAGSGFSRDEILAKVECLRHRGPDERGAYVDQNRQLAMAHQRLNIIDPEGGQQPLTRGGDTIVYNGEIYNYRSIRSDLKQHGTQFRTDCDTEVLLRAYQQWGVDCLERLRGMFSFCIWDGTRERLFLARDRLGQKPLVFSTAGNSFAAGSELQSLVNLSTVSRKMDPKAIGSYLRLKFIPSPSTGFRDIRKLEPAHYMLVQDREVVTQKRYWHPSYEPRRKKTFDTHCRSVRSKLQEAVRLRLRSDVPLGAFLSGGIDSSIVVSQMAKQSSRPINTFSVGFRSEDFNELPFAKTVAEKYQTNHTELFADPDIQDLLPKLARHYGEPFADNSAIPTYYVSRETSQHVKVALTGDAGDELFGGYRRYQGLHLLQTFNRWLPAVVRSGVAELTSTVLDPDHGSKTVREARQMGQALTGSPVDRYLSMFSTFDQQELQALTGESLSKEGAGDDLTPYFDRFDQVPAWSERTMLVDLMTFLPEQLLVKVDIASMMSSIECRSPFLDHEFIDLVTKIPIHMRMKQGRKKHLLKEAFREDLPETVLSHRKQGFSIPKSRWFRGELRAFTNQHLLAGNELFQKLFDQRMIERMLEDHVRKRTDCSQKLLTLLMLELWMESFDVDF